MDKVMFSDRDMPRPTRFDLVDLVGLGYAYG